MLFQYTRCHFLRSPLCWDSVVWELSAHMYQNNSKQWRLANHYPDDSTRTCGIQQVFVTATWAFWQLLVSKDVISWTLVLIEVGEITASLVHPQATAGPTTETTRPIFREHKSKASNSLLRFYCHQVLIYCLMRCRKAEHMWRRLSSLPGLDAALRGTLTEDTAPGWFPSGVVFIITPQKWLLPAP